MLLYRNVLLVLRRFQSSSSYFSMENLLPPREIRGMKILNKELFDKNVKVPCIVVKLNNLKETLKRVKPYMLKLIDFNPVRNRDDNTKEILLNPNIVHSYDDLKLVDREALSKFGEKIHFEHINVKITYNNWKASDILNSVIPKEIGSVSGYSIIGHIVHLNLKSELFDYKNVIGQVLLDKVPQAKTVVNKMEIIDNEFRTFPLEILAGISDFTVEVVENSCVYKFDFSKVYWNPRLSTEHLRIVEILKEGDYLYDAFAGVGPFTIPAAKKGCTVLANDLNSVAVEYLRANLILNKVKKPVMTTVKDAANFIKEDFKSHFIKLKPGDFNVHIIMNLPALAPIFLPTLKCLFSMDEAEKITALPMPRVYVYCFVKGESDPYTSAKQLISQNLAMDNLEDEIKSVSFVRNVAPNKQMMRVIIALSPRILVSPKRNKINKMKNQKKTNPFKVNHVRSIKSKAKAKAYSGHLKKLKDLVKTKVENVDEQLKNIGEILRQAPKITPGLVENTNSEETMKKEERKNKMIEHFKKTEADTDEALTKLENWSCGK